MADSPADGPVAEGAGRVVHMLPEGTTLYLDDPIPYVHLDVVEILGQINDQPAFGRGSRRGVVTSSCSNKLAARPTRALADGDHTLDGNLESLLLGILDSQHHVLCVSWADHKPGLPFRQDGPSPQSVLVPGIGREEHIAAELLSEVSCCGADAIVHDC